MGFKKKQKHKATTQNAMELQDLKHAGETVAPAELAQAPATAPMKPSGRFDYVRYDDAAVAQSAAFKEKMVELDAMLDQIFGACPRSAKVSRAREKAVTALEEAFMWIGKAIRDEQVASRTAELQEERNDA